MAKHALLVGIKSVDPVAYGGWDGKAGCAGCELDVHNVKVLLRDKQHFPENDIVRLKTKEATKENVLRALSVAASKCKPGDTFVFYYSGHGGQTRDKNGDELDGQDETLVCYNGELIDDELDNVWKKFDAGVHIVMLSDSCNSGSNHKGGPPRPDSESKPIKRTHGNEMKAMMIHLGAARDGTTADGYESGGAFTQALCNVYAEGFSGTLKALHQAILAKTHVLPQKAEYAEYGPTKTLAFKRFRASNAFGSTAPISRSAPLSLFSSGEFPWPQAGSKTKRFKAETSSNVSQNNPPDIGAYFNL